MERRVLAAATEINVPTASSQPPFLLATRPKPVCVCVDVFFFGGSPSPCLSAALATTLTLDLIANNGELLRVFSPVHHFVN